MTDEQSRLLAREYLDFVNHLKNKGKFKKAYRKFKKEWYVEEHEKGRETALERILVG